MKSPKTNFEWMRERLLVAAKIEEPDTQDLARRLERQWDPEFVEKMRCRLAMGLFRYGDLHHYTNPGHKHGHGISEIMRRMALYMQTGNGEHLVDVANYCMVEFMLKSHPNYHFHAQERHENQIDV